MIDPVLYDPPGGEGTSASLFSVMQPPSFPTPKLGSDGGYPAGTEMSPCTNSCHSDSLVAHAFWSAATSGLSAVLPSYAKIGLKSAIKRFDKVYLWQYENVSDT